jgi:hypothetical protein
MLGGSVTKIGRAYKKLTYIAYIFSLFWNLITLSVLYE